ncbi:hypothetical protein H9L17_07180 [Thermomonas brevis]|uniref:DUF6265 domain-containing protein n=1 Tax=Thermomonas brevis TaxID=215691 RepID=A0A7G9QX24_9GAMM|nr:DUF6265 family protein [Thermomonas brevis]QNN47899.1 hypothetical protein H9L17_07180 [Thermomonas brevis]
MRKAKAMLGAGLVLAAGAATAAGPEFDWLAGHWCGGSAGRAIDEVWLPEAGGVLLGMSRTVRGGKTESFEFMRIVPAGDDAGFHVQPNGVAPTVFAIAERGERRVRFENAAHDFPNRIEYRREGDALHAWIAGPGRDGKEMRIPFEYRRCGG